jgi:hypothetical protein
LTTLVHFSASAATKAPNSAALISSVTAFDTVALVHRDAQQARSSASGGRDVGEGGLVLPIVQHRDHDSGKRSDAARSIDSADRADDDAAKLDIVMNATERADARRIDGHPELAGGRGGRVG